MSSAEPITHPRHPRVVSPLVAILKDELRNQRVFLSAEEEAALTRPTSYDNEDDLAYDRIRHRRSWLQPVLRNRFIREGRPVAHWQAMIEADEAAAGEPTFITGLATHVLEWAARTSDRGAMFGGFAARLLSFGSIVFFILGAYGWTHDAGPVGIAFVVVAVALYAASRTVAARAKRRAAAVAEQMLSGVADGGEPASGS